MDRLLKLLLPSQRVFDLNLPELFFPYSYFLRAFGNTFTYLKRFLLLQQPAHYFDFLETGNVRDWLYNLGVIHKFVGHFLNFFYPHPLLWTLDRQFYTILPPQSIMSIWFFSNPCVEFKISKMSKIEMGKEIPFVFSLSLSLYLFIHLLYEISYSNGWMTYCSIQELGFFATLKSENLSLIKSLKVNCTCMGRFDTSGTSKNDNFP